MSHAVRKGLAGKAVVVTGASAGVGRATARAFARRGARIALIARGTEGLDAARREAEAAGAAQAIALPADTADAAAIFAAADRAVAELGGIDIWVNCAMATVFSPVTEISPEEYRRVTEVTYLGYVHGTLAALRHMRPRGAGTIVQVGSALAYRAIPLQSAYCAAKFAIRGFTDSLRCELKHEGSRIRLTMVQLPAVNTPQFGWARSHMDRRAQPVPPIHQPEPVAERILQAALQAPRELWVGGPSVQAILGTMVAPGLLDRLLARKGYTGQLTREAEPPGRPDNLMTPVPGDHGTHGRFDARARDQVEA
ncbi:SDR family oxidoreductase [Paracraurococcus lichenis]|uniref:SDR family oxidoreductase n=1 Tax=Paracraurococcus lichenis TaxID=3064888 RepID=A0ABT9DXY9_9PROT|nr:SDR family oxidoreductase [Paracraurococcus sp. LOR1-02]MDO9708762.1 SDR family oxidoreductase [Paracraurococcus sp. LOR1-02]